jgi:predicted DCC family thiol-disulfide oxidoreductase YuxK
MNQAILVYDGKCPLCVRARDWIALRTRSDSIRFLPCQAEELPDLVPSMSHEACMTAMQLVFPNGKIYAADKAVVALLPMLRGWRWVAPLARIPGAGLILPHIYAWIARNRYALSGLLAGKTDHT